MPIDLPTDGCDRNYSSWKADLLWPWPVAFLLQAVFWWPILLGRRWIGGDTYNYYLPLKQFYAEGLAQGHIPLWHPGIGHGISVLGESQTGALYPPHLLAYRWLGVLDAFHALFLFHGTLLLVFVVWLARYLGASRRTAVFVAILWTYGWFAPRACLEWALATGAWTPLVILATLGWLDTGRSRWGVLLTVSLALQLLIGHFQIAWTTGLAIAFLAAFWPSSRMKSTPPESVSPESGSALSRTIRRGMVGVWIASAALLSSPQLLATLEWKQSSHRDRPEFMSEVGYGNIPPAYWLQVVAPWWAYDDADERLRNLGGHTNRVEAHCYWSLVGVGLLLGTFLRPQSWWTIRNQAWPWLVLAVLGGSFATGVLSNMTASWPGFGYFRYPGRYSLLIQLGVVGWLATTLDRTLASVRLRSAVLVVAIPLALIDFALVFPRISYVEFGLPHLDRKGASEIFHRLEPTDRVLAMDANTLALSGAACVPTYLGLGPASYVETWERFPDLFHGSPSFDPKAWSALVELGVTHLLTEDRLGPDWPVEPAWAGYDRFLHPRWNRDARQHLWLYRIPEPVDPGTTTGRRGRAWLETPVGNRPIPVTIGIDRVEVEVDADQPGRVILADLAFPGWSVTRNGQPARWYATDTTIPLRAVDVEAGRSQLVWRYRPPWLWPSILGVTLGLLVLIAAASRASSW